MGSSSCNSLSSSSSSSSSCSNTDKKCAALECQATDEELLSFSNAKKASHHQTGARKCSATNKKCHLGNAKLTAHLSSSSASDCLSSDEGYFGSYTDKKNLNKQTLAANSSSVQQPLAFNQQNQVILLKYLLQNQHMTQLNNLHDSSLPESPHTTSSEVSNEVDIPNLNIFNSVKSEEDAELAYLLQQLNEDSTDEQPGLSEDSNTFDIFNLMSKSEKKLTAQLDSTAADSEELQKEIHAILEAQMKERAEQERLDELEMQSRDWRRLLEKRARLAKHKHELSEEDQVDVSAYLNEIEMNLDYFQSSSSSTDTDLFIDTLLRFSTNKMAFNLRNYHRSIEQELEERRQSKSKAKFVKNNSNQMMKMFANVHVDSIPEFTPYAAAELYSEYDNVEGGYEEDAADFNDQYDTTYIEQQGDSDESDPNQLNYDEAHNQMEDCNYQLMEHDYTMIDEGDMGNYEDELDSQTGDLVNDIADSADSEFYYEEDYEDYEDQVLIDSLSEQDALALLRNESEMYALQMAQASKSGILKASKNSRKKGRFNSGTSSTTTQSEVSSTVETTATNMGVDIFENVFNFDEMTSQSDYCDSLDEINAAEFVPETNGNISMSLRNSLLKLRHTRRHLAKLMDSKKSSSASSASSSLTNPATPLTTATFAKHIGQVSALSRKPCVYMLNEGRCMRADCRFAHDLKQITCKYWLDGECLKGDNCEFSHEYIEETPHKVLLTFGGGKKAAKANSLPKQEFKLDSEEFPALGGAPKKCALIETTPKQAGSSPISVTPPVQVSVEEQTSAMLFKTAASVLQSRAPIASPVTPKASQKKTSNESIIGKKPVLQAVSTGAGKSGRKSRESQAPKQTKSASAILTTAAGKSQVAAVPIKTAVSKSNANNSCGSSSSASSSSGGSNSSSRCNSIIRGKK